MSEWVFFEGTWQEALPYLPPTPTPRRRRNTGSFYLRADGMWIGRVELSPDRQRRQRSVSHTTFCGMLKKFTAMDKPEHYGHVAERLPDWTPYRDRSRRLLAAREIAKHTDAEWAEQLRKQDYRCHYCGAERRGALVKEHMTPLCRGGSDGIDNIVGACRLCNSKKGRRTAAEYLRLPARLR